MPPLTPIPATTTLSLPVRSLDELLGLGPGLAPAPDVQHGALPHVPLHPVAAQALLNRARGVGPHGMPPRGAVQQSPAADNQPSEPMAHLTVTHQQPSLAISEAQAVRAHAVQPKPAPAPKAVALQPGPLPPPPERAPAAPHPAAGTPALPAQPPMGLPMPAPGLGSAVAAGAGMAPVPAPGAGPRWMHRPLPFLDRVPVLGHITPGGFLHGLGEGLKYAGIAAGTEFAPGAMEMIPGTPQHAMVESIERQNAQREADVHQLAQTEEGLRRAQAWKDLHPQPREEPGEWVAHDGQDVYVTRSELESAPPGYFGRPMPENPKNVAWEQLVAAGDTPFEAWQKLTGKPLDPAASAFQFELSQGKNPMEAYEALHAEQKRLMSPIEDAMLARSILAEGPRINPLWLGVLPQLMQKAGITLTPAQVREFSRPGADWPMDAQGRPIPIDSAIFPVGSTKSRLQFSAEILPTVDGLMAMIRENPESVGPLHGSWNAIFSGRLGKSDPKYYAANMMLHNVATAWMRIHANSDQARQEFESLLSTSQSSGNLLAALGVIQTQLSIYSTYGKRPRPGAAIASYEQLTGVPVRTGAAPRGTARRAANPEAPANVPRGSVRPRPPANMPRGSVLMENDGERRWVAPAYVHQNELLGAQVVH